MLRTISLIGMMAMLSAVLVACATTQDTPSTATATTTQAPRVVSASCYPSRPTADPELAAVLDALTLPDGAKVITGMVGTQSEHPGQVSVHVYLCAPSSSTADALRPIATRVAAALRPTALGERTFALYVADTNDQFKNEAVVKDPFFRMHTWDGKASATTELQTWVTVSG